MTENFDFFWNMVSKMSIVEQINPKLIRSAVGIPKDENRYKKITERLIKSKVFQIDNNIKKLIALTDTPSSNEDEYLRLPFDEFFLDVSFIKEELNDYNVNSTNLNFIKGILVSRGVPVFKNPLNEKERIEIEDENDYINKFKDKEFKTRFDSSWNDFIEGKSKIDGLKITICIKTDDPKSDILLQSFNRNINPEVKSVIGVIKADINVHIEEFIHKFILNFLNFLNNPEVEYVEHKNTENNIKRRIKQGKSAISSLMTIKINGKLKEYIDEIENKGLWNYSHRFWVRGHFRDLRNEKYKEKKRIWIFPYIKGKGVLIDKDYVVKK